ncbi:MAG: hypothetical protein ACLTDR_13455 [Adlercreutzia equolifaciens]
MPHVDRRRGVVSAAARVLPGQVRSTGHLDPFHVNRAMSPASTRRSTRGACTSLDVLNDGDREGGVPLARGHARLSASPARKGRARVVGYLRSNIDLVAVEGPSLGTMESENQHLYGSRMDSVPCAWSRPGASAMARVISRKSSKRAIPSRPARARRPRGAPSSASAGS